MINDYSLARKAIEISEIGCWSKINDKISSVSNFRKYLTVLTKEYYPNKRFTTKCVDGDVYVYLLTDNEPYKKTFKQRRERKEVLIDVDEVVESFYEDNKNMFFERKMFERNEWDELVKEYFNSKGVTDIPKNKILKHIESSASKEKINFVRGVLSFVNKQYKNYHIFTSYDKRPYLDVFPKKETNKKEPKLINTNLLILMKENL
jgi:hypothetical protein